MCYHKFGCHVTPPHPPFFPLRPCTRALSAGTLFHNPVRVSPPSLKKSRLPQPHVRPPPASFTPRQDRFLRVFVLSKDVHGTRPDSSPEDIIHQPTMDQTCRTSRCRSHFMGWRFATLFVGKNQNSWALRLSARKAAPRIASAVALALPVCQCTRVPCV